VAFLLGIGLVGVTMNPAMVTRVQRAGDTGPLVNTVHSSFITLGVIVGSWAGGLAIGAFGLRGPLWLGAALAVVGLATLLPDLARRATRPARSPEASGSAVATEQEAV
jgi:predicted MFS family arabinose efflux permease